MADNFGLKIGLEGEKAFKNSLAEINQAFKVLGSEMKLVESEFDKNDKSVEALTARNEVLGKQIDAQKEKIEVLRAALKNASESFGENDKRTQAWQIQLNNAEAALNGMERELKSNNDAIEQSGKGMDEAGDEADEFGKEIDDAAKDEWDMHSYGKIIIPYSLFTEDKLKKNRTCKGLLNLETPPKFDLVIVDEAHHIRNSSTLAYDAVKFFVDNAEAAVFLTATPIQMGEDDLYTLLNLLRPDLVPDREIF